MRGGDLVMEYNYAVVQMLGTYNVLGIILIFCSIIWLIEQGIKLISAILKITKQYFWSDSDASDLRSDKEE